MCHPGKALRVFCKAFRKLCFPFMIAGQVGKSVCEDVDGKITVVLTFYAQTLGPFPYKATLQCCYFVTISAKF